MIIKKNKKVLVALSGGVDSSVSAMLLKKQGFSVIGVFLHLWKEERSSEGEERAKKVAETLNIPFYIFDFQEEFKKKVVDSFLFSLKSGNTPNPCVVCNREIKFGMLLEKLKDYNADYLSTGHYAKIKEGRLLKGEDENKDQSYFLWGLKREWLKKLIFPLGYYKKEEVREIAKKHNLPTAETKESQETCFIPDNFNSFLKRNISNFPGKIVDERGNIIGEHQGLFYYTLGQRKGLGFSGGPYYVLEKKLKKNILVVTRNKDKISKKELSYTSNNFFREVVFPFKAKVKIRYRGEFTDAVVDKGKVFFHLAQRAVTPGQSVVFYKEEEVLGGGIIK
jgi:tRNA-uridine 2-sulfurtransferase